MESLAMNCMFIERLVSGGSLETTVLLRCQFQLADLVLLYSSSRLDSLPLRHSAEYTIAFAQILIAKRGTRRAHNTCFHRTVRTRCYSCSFRHCRIYDGKRQSSFQLQSYLSFTYITLFRSLRGNNVREDRQSEPTGETRTHDTSSPFRLNVGERQSCRSDS